MIQKITLSIVAGILVGLVGSYLMYHGNSTSNSAINATSSIATSTATSSGKKYITESGITFETDADNPGSIEVNKAGELPKPVPSLTKAILYGSRLDSISKNRAQENIVKYRTELTKNPRQPDAWLILGVYYKMAEDYKAAEEVWIFVTKLSPKDKIAFNNLADLYQNFLHDTVKAEVNWKKTIELDPTYIPGYRGLHYLYVQTNQLVKARTILDSGLMKNPESTELKSLLEALK